MVLANMTVAKRLASDFPGLAFLRCQPSPHKYVMEKLQKSLEQRGIFLDIQSAGGLQAAMWHYAGDDDVSQARMMVLNNLCAKLMSVS
jgi:exoribonuclease R